MPRELSETGRELLEIFDFRDDCLSVIDIGSNSIEGTPPYRTLVETGLAHVIGFEPQSETVSNEPGETHLPYAVGSGDMVTFRICTHSGWSSTLRPDPSTLAVFRQYEEAAEVISEEQMATRRLDDIDEIGFIDLLKIDIQGGEMAVFQHGSQKLANAVFIHTEVAFMPLYEGQPTLGDIDGELRRQGFVPHTFFEFKRATVPPFRIGDIWNSLNQVLDGDMVYVRDFRSMERLDVRQIKAMGLIAHACYRSWDLAYFCLAHLAGRGAISPESGDRYLAVVNRLIAQKS